MTANEPPNIECRVWAEDDALLGLTKKKVRVRDRAAKRAINVARRPAGHAGDDMSSPMRRPAERRDVARGEIELLEGLEEIAAASLAEVCCNRIVGTAE